MTCTNTRIQIRNLSNFTTDAQTSGETMLEAAKASIKLTRKVLASNLMEGLQTRRVGTHKVEKVARMITGEDERNESVVKKILDIEVELIKKKEQNAHKVDLFKHVLETLIKKMKSKSSDFDALYQENYYGG